MRGRVFKRGPNSWALVLYLGRDPQTGKERRKWLSFKTKRDAEAAQAKYVNELNSGGTLPLPSKKLVGEYLEEWLRGHQPNLAPTTYASYRDTIKNHLAPELGTIRLRDLAPQRLREYVADKLAAGLSPTTVRYHVMLLHHALGQAMRDGLLARNVCDFVEVPTKQRFEVPTLDEEQVRLLLGEAKRSSPHYRLYLAAVTTGMRQGELLGLRRQDIDLTLSVASVRQTFYRLSGQQLFKPPKTAKSRRTVALPPVLVEELRQLFAEQDAERRRRGDCPAGRACSDATCEAWHDYGLVFCQPNGRPHHAHNIVRRDFRRVLALQGLRAELRAQGVAEEALPKGLPHIRFHDLRHAHATLLLQQGVHPKVVQERLGHSTISMTLDTYSHVMPGMQTEAARQLADRLFGKGVVDSLA